MRLVFCFALPLALSAQDAGLHDPVPGLSASTSLDAARRLVAADRFAEAEAELRRGLDASSASATARFLLGYTLLREHRPQESLAEYTLAARLRTPGATDLKNVANDYALLGDYADAERWMRQSLAADPQQADGWYDLGRIFYTEQRFADALPAFQHALVLLPGSSKVQNNIGLTLEGLNREEEALLAYREAIAWQKVESPPPLSPEQPLLNLGIALLRRGKLPEAQTLLEQAVVLAPQDPRIHEQLGQVFLDRHDWPAAQRELRKAVDLDPESAALHFRLGQAFRRAGMRSEAEVELKKSARLLGNTSLPGAP